MSFFALFSTLKIWCRFNREVAEWSKAHAWKVCILQKGIEGSNPFLSASKQPKNNKTPQTLRLWGFYFPGNTNKNYIKSNKKELYRGHFILGVN